MHNNSRDKRRHVIQYGVINTTYLENEDDFVKIKDEFKKLNKNILIAKIYYFLEKIRLKGKLRKSKKKYLI